MVESLPSYISNRKCGAGLNAAAEKENKCGKTIIRRNYNEEIRGRMRASETIVARIVKSELQRFGWKWETNDGRSGLGQVDGRPHRSRNDGVQNSMETRGCRDGKAAILCIRFILQYIQILVIIF